MKGNGAGPQASCATHTEENAASHQKQVLEEDSVNNVAAPMLHSPGDIGASASPEDIRQESQESLEGLRTHTRKSSEDRNACLYKAVSEHPKCVVIAMIVMIVMIVLLIVFSIVSPGVKPAHAGYCSRHTTCCPYNWTGHQGKCYCVSNREEDWNSSQNFCAQHDASLVKFTIKEKEFVMLQRGKNSIWIGLKKSGDVWRWTDGEEETEMTVSGTGGDCAYLDDQGNIDTSRCTTPFHWICNKAAISCEHKNGR